MMGSGKGTSGIPPARHARESVKHLITMLLAAATAAVLIGMLAGFLLYPAQAKQQELEREWAAKSSALQSELLKKDAGHFDPGELAALLRRVPTRPEREAFIRELREIARRSGVEIVSLKAARGAGSPAAGPSDLIGSLAEGAGGGSDKYEEIRYELELRGTWGQAAAFMRGINAAERLMAIPEWTITGQSSDASWRLRPMSMSMELVLYAGTGYEGKFSGLDVRQGGDDE